MHIQYDIHLSYPVDREIVDYYIVDLYLKDKNSRILDHRSYGRSTAICGTHIEYNWESPSDCQDIPVLNINIIPSNSGIEAISNIKWK